LLLLCTENAIRLFSLCHAIQVFVSLIIYHFLSLPRVVVVLMVLYSIQGTKKIINKKKLSSCCCFASLIHSSSNDIGLILVFSNGKIEIRWGNNLLKDFESLMCLWILKWSQCASFFSVCTWNCRSLADLSLLKDAFLRGFVSSRNLNSTSSIACSSDGETILVCSAPAQPLSTK